MWILLYKTKNGSDVWWPSKAVPFTDKAKAVEELATRRRKYTLTYEFRLAEFTED